MKTLLNSSKFNKLLIAIKIIKIINNNFKNLLKILLIIPFQTLDLIHKTCLSTKVQLKQLNKTFYHPMINQEQFNNLNTHLVNYLAIHYLHLFSSYYIIIKIKQTLNSYFNKS